MPLLVHELLLTLWKKLPSHFREHRKVCVHRGYGGSQCSEKSPNGQEALEKQNGLIGRTGLLGPNQLFTWTLPGTFYNSIVASPGKGKRPQQFTKVLSTIHITKKSNEPQDLEGSRIIPSWGSRYISTRRLQ